MPTPRDRIEAMMKDHPVHSEAWEALNRALEAFDIPTVVIESPYAGNVELNTLYVRACMRDSLLRGEAPFASHALYTLPGVLNEANPAEREIGIRAGFAIGRKLQKRVVYSDLGLDSSGVLRGIEEGQKLGQEMEQRTLPKEVAAALKKGLPTAKGSSKKRSKKS